MVNADEYDALERTAAHVDWDTPMPVDGWFNELTLESVAGCEVRPAGLFERFPVALLSRKAQSETRIKP